MHLVKPETHQRLQARHAQAATQIDNLQQVLGRTALDARVLSLCSDYFEAALREQDWSPSHDLTGLETACLDVCAQFMLSVASVGDEHIAALNRFLTADEVYNLMYAIYLIEASKRLDLMLEGMTP